MTISAPCKQHILTLWPCLHRKSYRKELMFVQMFVRPEACVKSFMQAHLRKMLQ